MGQSPSKYTFIHSFTLVHTQCTVVIPCDVFHDFNFDIYILSSKGVPSDESCGLPLSHFYCIYNFTYIHKCTLVQALRLCTGRTTQRGSRGIILLYRH
jgi:hypothetical protein